MTEQSSGWPWASGEMARRIRAYDWANTALGPIERWPDTLKTVIDLMLANGHAMQLAWGGEHLMLYNDAYAPMLGSRHPAALGASFAAAWPDVWDDIAPLVARVFQGETVRYEDMPLLMTRKGYDEETWWNFSYSPVHDGRGNVAGLLNVTVEVSGKHRAERERDTVDRRLQANIRRQAFLLQLSDTVRPLADIDAIGQTAARLLGAHLDVDGAVYATVDGGAWLIDMTHAPAGALPASGRHDAASYGQWLMPAYRRGEVVAFDDARCDPRFAQDERAALASLGVVASLGTGLLHQGELQALLAVHSTKPRAWSDEDRALLQEVAERTWTAIGRARAEGAQRESEERLRALVMASSSMIYSMSPDWKKMYKLAGQSVLADTVEPSEDWVALYLPPDDRAAIFARIDAAIRERTPFEMEHRVLRQDGSIGWIWSRAVPIIDADGTIREWFGSGTDVTQRKRTEEALYEADRKKDEFLAMLAHELRNPLAPISAAADLLAIAEASPEKVRSTGAVIARQTRHMVGLVDDLLDVSRVTRGQVNLKMERLDLKQIVAEAAEQVRPLFEAKRHNLAIHLLPAAACVCGDHKRLVQVVANLLTNAAKYTPDHGEATLAVDVADGMAHIRVSDNGIGIDAQLIGHVFELFTQAQRTPDRAQGGLGIGLALVRRLVELHDGTVHAYSAGSGQGSRFTVSLPLMAASAHEAHAPFAQPQHAAEQGLSILIVDDNEDAAQMLAMCLELLGHQVAVEHGAQAAIARAIALRPQVCLLDIGLPDMDGHALARALRQHATTRDAVLAAVSGYGQEQDKAAAEAAGFDRYFVKPINIAALTAFLSGLD